VGSIPDPLNPADSKGTERHLNAMVLEGGHSDLLD
jgi:hypothetical protein